MKELVENSTVKPAVKWAGGKYKLSNTIIETANTEIEFQKYDTYIEPFVGGGGMFLSMNNKFDFKRKIISDVNPELINMYLQIKNNVQALIGELIEFENEFNSLPSDEAKKEYYLNLRKKFNSNIDDEAQTVNQAAIFIGLNKLGFNGLYRVNRKGHFNVPFGQKKTANLFDHDNIIKLSEVLKNTEIYLSDYKKMIDFATSKTLFYFDSPYRPLPNSPSFTAYAKSEFNDDNQKELAEMCQKLYKKGGSFILSNSDPKQIDSEDNFFDNLYSDFIIKRISARRAIGATAARRGMVSEILVLGNNKQS